MKSDIENALSTSSSSSQKQKQANMSLDDTDTDDSNNPPLFIKRTKVNNALKAMSYITSSFSIYKKKEEFFDIHKHSTNDLHNILNNKRSRAWIELTLLAKYWNSYFRTPFILWVLWLSTG